MKTVETLNTTKGVVVDNCCGMALLYYAIKEGLADEDLTIGNGFVRRVLEKTPYAHIRDKVFEQLILGGKIYLPFWIPSSWKGSIFESEIVESLPHIKDDEKIKVSSLNNEILLEMLADRGYSFNHNSIQEYMQDYFKKSQKFDEISNGSKYSVVSALFGLMEIETPGTYTKEQIEKALEVSKAYEKISPIMKIIDEYETVLTYSMLKEAYSSLPINVLFENNIPLPKHKDIIQEQALLRISSKEMEIAPIGYSLSQTIDLLNTPEA